MQTNNQKRNYLVIENTHTHIYKIELTEFTLVCETVSMYLSVEVSVSSIRLPKDYSQHTEHISKWLTMSIRSLLTPKCALTSIRHL